jgi:hypothetical protein
MKNDAERRGAELAPTSLTAGMSSGKGAVSMSTCWENLMDQSVSQFISYSSAQLHPLAVSE